MKMLAIVGVCVGLAVALVVALALCEESLVVYLAAEDCDD